MIGNAQPGAYRLYLWNKTRRTYKEFAAGVSTDDAPDAFTLPGPIRALQGRFVEWNVLVSGAPGDRYDVTVRFTQGGVPLAGGEFRHAGTLAKPTEVLADLARLVGRA